MNMRLLHRQEHLAESSERAPGTYTSRDVDVTPPTTMEVKFGTDLMEASCGAGVLRLRSSELDAYAFVNVKNEPKAFCRGSSRQPGGVCVCGGTTGCNDNGAF